jgi:hypothetical protein
MVASEVLTVLEIIQENSLMVENAHATMTDISDPVEVEINDVGELVVVFKTIPEKFEQKFDRKKMTYTLHATWK